MQPPGAVQSWVVRCQGEGARRVPVFHAPPLLGACRSTPEAPVKPLRPEDDDGRIDEPDNVTCAMMWCEERPDDADDDTNACQWREHPCEEGRPEEREGHLLAEVLADVVCVPEPGEGDVGGNPCDLAVEGLHLLIPRRHEPEEHDALFGQLGQIHQLLHSPQGDPLRIDVLEFLVLVSVRPAVWRVRRDLVPVVVHGNLAALTAVAGTVFVDFAAFLPLNELLGLRWLEVPVGARAEGHPVLVLLGQKPYHFPVAVEGDLQEGLVSVDAREGVQEEAGIGQPAHDLLPNHIMVLGLQYLLAPVHHIEEVVPLGCGEDVHGLVIGVLHRLRGDIVRVELSGEDHDDIGVHVVQADGLRGDRQPGHRRPV
mmetsp:Transcript_73952/g.213930  ORF Transcript_73952/g.213930 Transcript_73952/m.213930 type:complete len:369 (+) Transcript_73952:1374-2480(+)